MHVPAAGGYEEIGLFRGAETAGPPEGERGDVPNGHCAGSMIETRFPHKRAVSAINNQQGATGAVLACSDDFVASIAGKVGGQQSGGMGAVAIGHSATGSFPEQTR